MATGNMNSALLGPVGHPWGPICCWSCGLGMQLDGLLSTRGLRLEDEEESLYRQVRGREQPLQKDRNRREPMAGVLVLWGEAGLDRLRI